MQPQNNSSQAKDTDTSMYFVDAHTHLLDYGRESHLMLEEILYQCKINNVKYLVANACCTKQFKYMEDLYKKQLSLTTSLIQKKSLTQEEQVPQVTIIPCFGIHPCYISEQLPQENINNQDNQQNDWKILLRKYLQLNPISQVGEIGLDFRKDVLQCNSIDKQWQYFEYQFQLAIQLQRSVTIHCVRAYGQLLKFLKKENTKHGIKQKQTNLQKQKQAKLDQKNQSSLYQKDYQHNHYHNKPIIILHSYGGSKQITKSLNKLQHLQIYFSLSLKHSKDILSIIPLEKLLLETDAPYQNDNEVLIENQLSTKEQLEAEQKLYRQLMASTTTSTSTSIPLQQPPCHLLKQCKFFNKSILNNRPKHVIANYRQIAKFYQVDLNAFIMKVTKNALKAFKLLK